MLRARLVTAILLAFTLGAATMPSSWTMFRRSPSGNAVVGGTLTARWAVETNGPISSSPSVVDGVLYTDNNKGWLTAIAVRDGRTLWRVKMKDALMSAPLVLNGLVIVGEGNENSTTYVPRRRVVVGNGENRLVAVDAGNGRQRRAVPLQGSGMPSPAVVDGVLVHHDGRGTVVAVDPESGDVLWKRHIGAIASMSDALPTGGGSFVTDGLFPSGVWKLRASDGATIWSVRFSSNDSGVGDCPAATDGRRIFCDYIAPAKPGEQAGVGTIGVQRVYAVDAANGRFAWNIALEPGMVGPRNESGIPVYADGSVFIGSAIAPYVHALDAASGAVRWKTKVYGPVKGGLVIVGGVAYCGDFSGYLWALNEKTGTVIGSKKMGTPFNVGSPIVIGKTLVIGSATGRVIALPLAEIRGAHD